MSLVSPPRSNGWTIPLTQVYSVRHWQCELQERKNNFNLDGAFRRMIEKSTLISVLDGNGNLFSTVIDDLEIKRQKDFERRGPKPVPNDAFLQPSLFSLQTTFKGFFGG